VTELISRNAGPSLGWMLFGSLAVWVIRQFVLGRLVSRTGNLDWRDAYEKSEQARSEERRINETQTAQLTEMLELARSHAAWERAVQQHLAGRGEPDVVA
jgi:hypothetical protein